MKSATLRRRGSQGYLSGLALVFAALFVIGTFATGMFSARADNFTDIFYTNSFRGAFQWFTYLDWVGTLVQIVISAFSLFGVALMTIRIMTSLLFLSAKGMWEEVHDLKAQGGSEEKDLFGILGMGKSWVQGKAGTGLDAIVGAALLLLPDVKRYSDFGEKAGGDFSTDMTVTQYILKIAVPTVMTVFFFAMGFNGTLFHALAVTVDFLGDFADRAISVNYVGLVDDLINRNTGYTFTFDLDGTQKGKYQQALAKDIFGRVISKVKGIDTVGMDVAGRSIQEWVANMDFAASPQLTDKIKAGLGEETTADAYIEYLGSNVIINTTETVNGELDHKALSELLGGMDGLVGVGQEQYVHVFITQNGDYNGAYLNVR